MLRIFCLLWLAYVSTTSAAALNGIWLLDIKGAIGVATMEYVLSGIDAAHQTSFADKPQLIILRMDTPGGLDEPMRQIIQRILSSDIPIVGYVAPQGARAASAGTYIMYAVHVAAMAQATTLGAATPVQLGGVQPASNPGEKKDGDAPAPANAMERKIINDATAYIEGLADLRKRNRDWAALAVRSAASLSAQEAFAQQVVNLIADDVDDLVTQLDGTVVSVKGKDIKLSLARHKVFRYEATWRHEFLSIMTNPNVAYILMLAGIYGLFFEFSNPGMGAPGIIGALCIFLALYAFQMLPISYAGAGIILLGIGLMVAEAMSPSFGVFGIGGIVAFVIGSIILIDTAEPAFQIATPIIAAVTISSAAFTFLTVGMLLKNRRRRLASGIEELIGELAPVEVVYEQHPMVRVQGELWQVNCNTPLAVGDKVKILSVQGLILNVSKVENVDG